MIEPYTKKERKLFKALTKRYGKRNGAHVYQEMAKSGKYPNNFGYQTKRLIRKGGE